MTHQEIHDLFCRYWHGPVSKLEQQKTESGESNKWFELLKLYAEKLERLDREHVDKAARKLWQENGPYLLPVCDSLVTLARQYRDDQERIRDALRGPEQINHTPMPDWVRRANRARGKDAPAWIAAMMERMENASEFVKQKHLNSLKRISASWPGGSLPDDDSAEPVQTTTINGMIIDSSTGEVITESELEYGCS